MLADPNNYRFLAVVTREVDGDTVWLRANGAFRNKHEEPCRLYGINTPERKEPGWAEACAFTAALLPVGLWVLAATHKPTVNDGFEKYGRWLVEVTLPDGRDVGATVIAAGHAVSYLR